MTIALKSASNLCKKVTNFLGDNRMLDSLLTLSARDQWTREFKKMLAFPSASNEYEGYNTAVSSSNSSSNSSTANNYP